MRHSRRVNQQRPRTPSFATFGAVGLLLFSFAVGPGCGADTSEAKRIRKEKWSTAFNEERVKRGLPVLPENWNFHGRYGYWNSPLLDAFEERGGANSSSGATLPAGHHGLNTRTGKYGLEQADEYYSGNIAVRAEIFHPDDVSDSRPYDMETLNIVCTFPREDVISGRKWTFILMSSDETLKDPETLEEAEELLRKWGLERLNYEVPDENGAPAEEVEHDDHGIGDDR